ncbi:unnamed protein product [Gulo gulo]|uniref:Uncharacterized protein n=1 Tax=Gulo gulo TaxID=48420 RepID=A0A9X9M238_GULGU|nr:unnamed protein product [Gulo gulo]
MRVSCVETPCWRGGSRRPSSRGLRFFPDRPGVPLERGGGGAGGAGRFLMVRSDGRGGYWFPCDCSSSPLALDFGGGRGSFPGFGDVVDFVFQFLFCLKTDTPIRSWNNNL